MRTEHTSVLSRFVHVAVSVFIAFAFVALIVPDTSFAAPSDEKKKEADAARERLAEVRTELGLASDRYYEADEAHKEALAKMDEEKGKIDSLKGQISESQDALRKRAVTMYRSDQISLFDVLLGSTSFKDFSTTWSFLVELNEDTSDLITKNKDLKAESEAAYTEYHKQEEVAAQKLEEANEAKAQAEELVAQYQSEVESLDAEVEKLIAEEEAAREAAEKAEWERQQRELAAQQAAEQAAQQAEENEQTEQAEIQTDENGVDQQEYGTHDTSGDESDDSNATNASNATNIPSGSGVGDTVVSMAYSRLGCPYVWAASGPNAFDCSGLTSWCYAQAGISLPRTSGAQHYAGTVIPLSSAQPGDILWMPGHVGIYVGGGQYIHAPQPGDVVRVSSYMSMWSCAVRI